jgi:hypothetical protein
MSHATLSQSRWGTTSALNDKPIPAHRQQSAISGGGGDPADASARSFKSSA